jgi:hypothetical protein
MLLRNECLGLKFNFPILFVHPFFKTLLILLTTNVFRKNTQCLHLFESKANILQPFSSSNLNEKIAYFDNQLFHHNLQKCPTQGETGKNTLKNFFNPTVVKATAIKKFKIFDVNSYYSIVFHIKRIFKYENRVVEINSSPSKHNNSFSNYFRISSQEENSTMLNTNSIILVDFFNLKGNENCMSQVEIGSEYFLFLKSLNPSIKLDKRRYFATGLNPKHFTKHKLPEADKNKSEIFSIKMPIFDSMAAPLLDEIDSKTEDHIQEFLCFMDAFCLVSKEQEKFSSKKELQRNPVTKSSLKITNTQTLPAKALKNHQKTSSKSSKQVNTRDQYIKCQKERNTCENDGECFITNVNFYLFKSGLDKTIISFCM